MKPIKKILSHISKIFSQIVSFPSKLLPSRWIRRMNTDQRRVFNLAVTGIVVVVGTWTISSLLAPDRSEASWWDDGWLYRQAATVTNSNGTELTDFQVSMTIDTSTLISAGKMQNNCDDIRITDQNGQLLSHWIETGAKGCNTAATTIWVKAASIPTSGSIVFLYYGNPSANSTANGDLVFEFFDDFSGSSLNTSKWTGDISNFTVADGYLNGTSNAYRIQSNISFTGNYEVITRINSTTLPSNGGFIAAGFYESSSNGYGTLYFPSWYTWNDNSFIGKSAFDFVQWTRLQTKVIGTAGSVQITGETSGSTSTTDTNSGIANESLALGTRYDNHPNYINQAYDADWDWIIVRKAITTEPTVTFGSEEQSPGPIAHWKFDEGSGTTANDATGKNQTGTITGATWTTDCIRDKCLDFDAAQTDYVTLSSPTELNKVTNKITISAWVKWRGNGTGGDQMQMAVATHSNGSLRFGTRSPSTTGTFGVYCGVCTTTAWFEGDAIPKNEWHHLAVTMDGSTIKMYQNGKLTYTGSYSGNIVNSADYWTLGSMSGDTYNWNGLIDEVKVYPYARTADQIKIDYNSGSAAVLGAKDANLNNGLVGYWKMDEVSGTSLSDSSGNGNNGTASDLDTANADTDTPPPAASGKYSYARDFDGVDDTVTVAHSSSFNVGTTYTVSAWIKPDSLITTQGFFGMNSGPQLNISIGTDGQLHGSAYRSMSSEWPSYDLYGNSGTVKAGEWQHIVFTVKDTELKLYYNGQLDKAGTISAVNTTAGTGGIYLGQTGMSWSRQWFDGSIAEVRLYNRALSPSEVQQLYNYAPPAVAYWSMEEASGTLVADISGNNRNGTATSGTLIDQGKYGKSRKTIDSTGGITFPAYSTPPTWTAMAWVKFPLPTTSGGWRTLLGHNGGSYHHILIESTGMLGTYNGAFYSSGFDVDTLSNDWHHVTAVGEGTTTKFYIDGVLRGTSSSKISTSDFSIIGNYALSGAQWSGLFDEAKIYNYARTPSQIIEDMNAGHPIGGSPVGSMVGHWSFDEGSGTTANNSGNGGSALNGTLSCFGTNCILPTWNTSGKVNKALNFSGNGTIGTFVTTPPINVSSTTGSQITVSAWIRPEATQPTGGWIIRNGKQADLNYGFNLSGLTNGNYGMAVQIYNGTSFIGFGTTGRYIPTSTWSHVTMIFTQGQDFKLYVNGVLKETVSVSGTSVQATTSFNIGGHNGTTSQVFNGSIDEVKVYTAALTAEEIKIDYNSGKSLQLGALGTDASGNPSNASDRAYCPPGDTTATCGPIAEWLFEEGQGTTTADTSGNNNNGTLTGGPAWYPNGKVGSALNFDGTDDYVAVADSNSLDVTSTFTLQAWIKRSGTTNGTNDAIISKGASSGSLGMYFDTSNRLAFVVEQVSLVGNSGIAITDTNWHHVAVTRDSSNSYRFYIDGSLKNTVTNTNAPTANTNNLTISSAVNPLGGKIDQVQIFNYELSPSQIAWNFSQGAPIAHYRFNECQGGTVHSSTLPYNSALDGIINIGASGTQTALGTCQTASTAWGNGATGKYGGSLNFDGTDDIVVTGDITDNITTYSVSLWFKHSGTASSTILQRGWSDSCRYEPQIAINNNTLSTKISGCSNAGLIGSTSVSPSSWNHVVVTVNGTTQVMYVNGKKIAETNNATAANANSKFFIGGTSSDGTTTLPNYQGQIDDVQIFNYGLTAQQVKTLYNNGAVYFGQ